MEKAIVRISKETTKTLLEEQFKKHIAIYHNDLLKRLTHNINNSEKWKSKTENS